MPTPYSPAADGDRDLETLRMRLRHDVVALVPLDMGHETQSAGVVFVGGRIQPVLLQMLNFGGRGHGALLSFFAGEPRLVHCSMPMQEK